MSKVLGLVLAGGQSRRMGGQDKAFMLLNGVPMLSHVVARAKPQVDALVLNSNSDPAKYVQYDLPVIADKVEGFAGPLAGIHAGMTYARDKGFKWMATWACDAPFTPTDFVEICQETQRREKAEIVVASSKTASGYRTHPVAALWSVSLLESLTAFLESGERKVDLWTAQHKTVARIFEYDDSGFDPFFNVNRSEDLKAAEKISIFRRFRHPEFISGSP